jgi:hypothetical protein
MPVNTLFNNLNPENLAIGGLAFETVGQISQGISANKQAQVNAQIYEAQARNIQAQKQMLSRQYATKANQLEGQAIATAGRAGVKISGSVASTISRNMEQLALDESIEQYNLSVERQKALDNARLQKYKGRYAILNGMYNAGSTLLTKGADIYNKYYKDTSNNGLLKSGGYESDVLNPTANA